MKISAKPRIDPTTGCAHIINWEHPAFGCRRCCSYCYHPQPKDVPEEQIESCWKCGEKFDHADDDPREPEDYYD